MPWRAWATALRTASPMMGKSEVASIWGSRATEMRRASSMRGWSVVWSLWSCLARRAMASAMAPERSSGRLSKGVGGARLAGQCSGPRRRRARELAQAVSAAGGARALGSLFRRWEGFARSSFMTASLGGVTVGSDCEGATRRCFLSGCWLSSPIWLAISVKRAWKEDAVGLLRGGVRRRGARAGSGGCRGAG